MGKNGALNWGQNGEYKVNMGQLLWICKWSLNPLPFDELIVILLRTYIAQTKSSNFFFSYIKLYNDDITNEVQNWLLIWKSV